MIFNSYVFILFFLPLCIIGYFGFNHIMQKTLAQLFLLGMSLWFYAYFNTKYLSIIIFSTVCNYLFYKILIVRLTQRKLIMIVAVIIDLGILFYYKYFDFFLENINAVFHTDFTTRNIILPLGISFFTFQQISFIIDTYREPVPPPGKRYNFIEYASFVTFFPQLVAGPIVSHEELIPQFRDDRRKKFDWSNFSEGIYIFVLGLAKKVLIADTFGNAVNWGFTNISLLNTKDAVIIIVSYTIQIYFDFSGYCDMAIGIGKMLNIDLPVNFNSPYKARTITEFWKRWHITLTRFFTKYVYIPLGGNRKGAVRTYINILVVYLLSGLWHGANWTFVFWGFCHGVFCVITRWGNKIFERIPKVVNWMITFAFLNVSWLFFRADTIRDGFEILRRVGQVQLGSINSEIVDSFMLVEVELLFDLINSNWRAGSAAYLGICFFSLISFGLTLFAPNSYEKMKTFKPTFFNLAMMSCLLIWCIMSLSGVSTFLYFNF